MFLLLMGFVLLLAAGVTASYVILQRQADDGLLVNLAGRQRMLTQKMTKESLELANASRRGDLDRISDNASRLEATMRVFEATLIALKDGGPAPTNLEMTAMRESPGPGNAAIASQLSTVSRTWKPFKSHLEALIDSRGQSEEDVVAIADSNLELLREMNAAVGLMQADSESKVNSLYIVQSTALALGLILVGLGAWMSRNSIAGPIKQLARAAQAMSKGDLSVECSARGAREVEELGASFDRMRAAMAAAYESHASGDDI